MNSKALILALFVTLSVAQNSIRFINNVNGTIKIYSDKLDTVTLAYMGVSPFYPVSDGTISITNVLDSNGSSLTGGTPLLTSFGAHYTLVATDNDAATDPTKRFVLALFNESAPADIDQSTDSTKTWIRFLILSQDYQYLTLASPAGAIVSYAGFLTYTPYTSISASTTSMRIYKSDSQTYNTPLITFDTSFTGLEGYTIIFFSSNNGATNNAVVNLDRAIGSGPSSGSGTTTTGAAGTTTTGSAQSTGNAGTTTTGVAATTTSEVTTGPVINNNENSASKLAFGFATLVALIALF